MNPLEERDVTCPYCDATFSVLLDVSAGDQRYIEDCEVCCQPIEFVMQIGDQTVSVELSRMDEV